MAGTLTAVKHRGFGMATGVEHVPNKPGIRPAPVLEKPAVEDMPQTLTGVLDLIKVVNSSQPKNAFEEEVKAKKLQELGLQHARLASGPAPTSHTAQDLRQLHVSQNAHVKALSIAAIGRTHPEVKELADDLAASCAALAEKNSELATAIESLSLANGDLASKVLELDAVNVSLAAANDALADAHKQLKKISKKNAEPTE